MIRVRVAIEAANGVAEVLVLAPSIREAVALAGGDEVGARVVFPIDGHAFFAGSVAGDTSPQARGRACVRARTGAPA